MDNQQGQVCLSLMGQLFTSSKTPQDIILFMVDNPTPELLQAVALAYADGTKLVSMLVKSIAQNALAVNNAQTLVTAASTPSPAPKPAPSPNPTPNPGP